MATFLVQSTVATLVFYLETTAGVAATGLDYNDVAASLKKSDDASFVTKALTINSFVELGDGFYALYLSEDDTDTVGLFYARITGSGLRSGLVDAYVDDAVPDSPVVGTPVTTTALFGHVYKANGDPHPNVSVQVRIVSQPTMLHPGTEGLVLSDSLVTTRTDAAGYFIITLVAGTAVDFMIPAANYRRFFTVPSSNQNVFDIP